MDRRHFLKLSTSSVVLAALPLWGKSDKEYGKRPNVILILTDDQGFGDTGIHGNTQIKTPNIDRLAKEGNEFTRFYVEPVCAPTRSSLMTGRYYYRTGILNTSRGGAKMAGNEITLAEILQQNGYRTGIFGKWHLGDNYPMRPQDQGFDETLVHRGGGIGQTPDQPNSYFDPLLWKNGKNIKGKGYCADIFFDAAMEFIEKSKSDPFFIYLPTNTPHFPIEVEDKYSKPYLEKGIEKEDAEIYGMIKNIDMNMGRLFKFLKTQDKDDNTVIIYISDNGPNSDRYNAGLRRRKSSNYEGGIRAISYIRWGEKLKAGRKIDSIAAHIDILPTVLDICGVNKPDHLRLDGKSLLPLLENKIDPDFWPERTLFIQCHRGLTPKRYQNCAVVTQRFKMVGYPGTFSNELLQTSESTPKLELYDLENDMGETTDIAHERPAVLSRLRKEYDAWFDDVKASRKFNPGIIHLGTENENPATLCRYQDATYIQGIPRGWQVIIEPGQYKLIIDRDKFNGPGTLVTKWQGREQRVALAKNENSGLFHFSAGKGRLEIWFELDGVGRITFSGNGTIGDVEVLKL